MFGHYQQSITDAEEALRINVDSVSARGCLGILSDLELNRELRALLFRQGTLLLGYV